MTTNIEELEDFKLIWLDKMFSYSDKDLSVKLQLQHITPYLKTFFNVDECFDYISNSEVDYNILIISTNSFNDVDIIRKASLLMQITFLYVISSAVSSDNELYSKYCHAIFTNTDDLLVKLSEDVQFCTENTIKFNIFTSRIESGKSSKDLRKQSTKFIWYQHMLEILINISESNEAKKDFIDFSRSHYRDDLIGQDKITDFEINYQSEDAIKWYTRDSFLYRIVNKVLRSESADHMYKLRYILSDIYTQLLELHCDYLQLLIDLDLIPYTITVYRGQFISNRELDQLKRNIGCYISMNTFLSTSTDRQVSLIFVGLRDERSHLESILFEISIHTDTCSLPYADLTMSSFNKHEKEILLAFGAIFRVESVESENEMWIIKLTLCNQEVTEIKAVHDFLPKLQNKSQQSMTDYADCLFHIGEISRAVEICLNEIQLKTTSYNWDSLVLFNNLAVYSMKSGETDFQSLAKCYQMCIKLIPRQVLPLFANILINATTLLREQGLNKRAREFIYKIITMIDNDIDATVHDTMQRLKMTVFAESYITLAAICSDQDKVTEALDYLQSALKIFRGHLSSSDEKFGWIYDNIANVYFKQGKYSTALEFGQKALQIYLQYFPSGHINIANCYHFLALTYLHNGETSTAWKLMDTALEYRLKAKPINRISVGVSYMNFGDIFHNADHDVQALAYYFKAQEMWRQYLSESNFRFAQLYAAIGRVYGKATGDFIIARSFLDKALEIELNHLKTNSLVDSHNLGIIYNDFGENYYRCGTYNEALLYYEKSTAILERTLPSTHIALFHLYSRIAMTYQDVHDYTLALKYYHQALDIIPHQESSSLNKELIGNTYGNIGTVYLQNNSYREAICYFEKDVNSKLEVMTSESPALISSYLNLGSAHSSLNNFTEASNYLQRALHIAKIVLPKYHEDLAYIYNSLASLYVEKGENDQALEYAKLSLEIKQNCMPSDHPSLANAYNTLGCIYSTFLDYHESVANYKAALIIFQKHQSDKYLVLATINTNLAYSYYQLDQLDQAIDYLQQALAILRIIHRENNDKHFQFAFPYDTLARVKCAQGFIDEAESYCQKAFDLRSTELSPENVDIGLSFETFGIIKNARMNYNTALIYFHKCETILRCANEEYPTLVRVYHGLGSVFYNKRQYDKAFEYYMKTIQLATKLYPKNRKLMDRLNYGLDRVIDHFFAVHL